MHAPWGQGVSAEVIALFDYLEMRLQEWAVKHFLAHVDLPPNMTIHGLAHAYEKAGYRYAVDWSTWRRVKYQ
jgi:hypothetical protein